MEGAEEDNKKKMKEWTGLEFADSQTKLRELLRTAQTSGRAVLELNNSALTNSAKVMEQVITWQQEKMEEWTDLNIINFANHFKIITEIHLFL